MDETARLMAKQMTEREKEVERLRLLAADLDEQGDHEDATKCREEAEDVENGKEPRRIWPDDWRELYG